MHKTPIESLTPKERDCLRLVSPDRKSAVIADMLGIAVPTVETHIRSARQKLGGVSRFAASRLLEQHEARQSQTSQPLTMPVEPYPELANASSRSNPIGSAHLTLHDVSLPFDHGSHMPPAGEQGPTRYGLNTINRLALIAFSLLALVIAGIAAIPLSDAVQHVARTVMTPRKE